MTNKLLLTFLFSTYFCFIGYSQEQKLDRKQKSTQNFKFNDSFNTGFFDKRWRNKEITKNNSYEIDTISGLGRNSDGFLITEMNFTGKYGISKRSEYGIKLYDSINNVKFLSFSFKIPDDYKYDNKNLGRETMICQWHSKPAPGKSWKHYKEYNEFNRPSVALYVTTNDNLNYYLVLRYGNNGKKEFSNNGHVWSTVAVKKIALNKWYDMAFEIKWSFTNSGYIASWVNNEPFTPFNGLHNNVYGANMHNASPAYFKFGQYRYWDDTHKHRIYFDELRVGDSFEEVYDSLPKMFHLADELRFIQNQK